MIRRLAAFVIFSPLLLAACRENPHRPLYEGKLPGFSVALPDGEILVSDSSPTGGKHSVAVSSSMFRGRDLLAEQELEVHWSNRTLPPQMWRDQLLPSMASTLTSGNPDARLLEDRTLGEDRWLYIVGTEDSPAGVGVVNCDPHFAVIVSYVRYRDRARLSAGLEDILRSVRCEVTDANRAVALAATRLPDTFGRIEHPFAVQAYRSINGEYLGVSVASNVRMLDVGTLRALTHAMIKGMAGVDVGEPQVVQEFGPDSRLLLLRAPRAEGSPLYVAYLRCEAIASTISVFWAARVTDDESARVRMSWIGCPGSPSTPSPDFSTVAAAACIAGNQQACTLMKSPTGYL